MKPMMNRRALEAALAERAGTLFAPPERVPQEPLPTGIAAVDRLTGGLPRGAITEISGEVSSGRTSFVAALLAQSSRCMECIAYIDVTDSMDPLSLRLGGVDLDRLLWIRCGGRLEHALRIADLVLNGGGFGVTVFDLADVPPEWARRIPMSYWFRFRRAVENKPYCCVLVDRVPCAGTCASLAFETRRETADWRGHARFRLLVNAQFNVQRRKPAAAGSSSATLVASGAWPLAGLDLAGCRSPVPGP